MKNNEKFYLPARKRQFTRKSEVVRISPEAYNAAVEMFNDSGLPLSMIVSKAILFAAENIFYEEER